MNKEFNAAAQENGWVSCGIPSNREVCGEFWTQWAASRDSRKCPCGRLVITGICPDGGRKYGEAAES